ncbi:MAG: hypothetical protein OXH75_18375 [Acidobacteria bacterium]|nr:hypothetical protein [Acidobacteriota bacterium]
MGWSDRWRRAFGLATVGALAGAGLACGPSGALDGAPDTSGGAAGETVRLEVTHRSEWRQLWIEGATDLPDGAHVNYQVVHELGERAPADEWPAANLISSGRAAVRDGQYWTRINTFNWPPGAVRVRVQFPLPPQPPEVAARYGALGEHLTGNNIVDLAGTKAVEVEHTFDHRR